MHQELAPNDPAHSVVGAGAPIACAEGELPRTVQDTGDVRQSEGHNSTMDSKTSSKKHRAAYAKYAGAHKERNHSDEVQEEMWPDPTKYNHRSLFLLTLKNPARRFLIASIEWKWWDRTVLLLILLNTLQLGFIYNPFDVDALRPDSSVRDLWANVGMVRWIPPPPPPFPPPWFPRPSLPSSLHPCQSFNPISTNIAMPSASSACPIVMTPVPPCPCRQGKYGIYAR